MKDVAKIPEIDSTCVCGREKKYFMKDMDGTNLEEVFGCPRCEDTPIDYSEYGYDGLGG